MMDFKSRPYSQFMENQIVEMYEQDPRCIALCYINKNEEVGTCYFNADHTDMLRMIDAMMHDRLFNWISVNADTIANILVEEEPEDESEAE